MAALLLLLVALPVAFVVLLVAIGRRGGVTVGVDEHAGVVEIARHTRRWRVVGLFLGAVVAVLLFGFGGRVDALGRVTALAPTALGAGILLGTIAGELTARPSVGIRRSAAVETRTLRAILPRGRALVLGISTALLVSALAIGAAWGSADDRGRTGRSFGRSCTVDDPGLGSILVSGSHGPWPGSFYALPLLVALLALAALVVVALRAIVARPRPELDSRGLDTMLRGWAVGNVLTAATVTVLGTLGPVALLMFSALTQTPCEAGVGQTVVAWTAAVVGPVATGAAFALLAGLVVTPTIRVDDLTRRLPGDSAPVGAPVR